MSCFDVQILDPNINTIEIETCIGDQPASIEVLTYDNTSLVEVNHCVALLPSEMYDLITVKDILAGSGISVSDSSGIYTVSLSNPTIYTSGIIDFLEGVQDIIGLSGLIGNNYIAINYNDNTGFTTISATGLQPSGNYSIVGHAHLSTDITDFSSSVSGLLPVKNISAGSGIGIISLSGDYTVSVTGTFGLTSEEVDDRVNSLLKSGNYINLNYNDNLNELTISVTGLQPVGNYALLYTGDPTTIEAENSWVDRSFSLWNAAAESLGLMINDDTIYLGQYFSSDADIRKAFRDVLQLGSAALSNSGDFAQSIHNHLSTDISDFNSAVSGLIPPSNFTSLTGLSGIVVSNSGTDYYVSLNDPTIQLVDITDLSSNARNFLLTPSSNNLQTLVSDETGSGIVVFNDSPVFSGIPTVPTAPSGTNSNQIASTAFVRTEISNLVDSSPSTLDTLNELAAALGDDPNFATTITNSLANKANLSGAIFTGPVTIPSGTGNFNSLSVNGTGVSISGHTHSYTDIINFASGIDQEVSTLLVAGSYINLNYDNIADTLTISASGLQPSGNYANAVHTHSTSDITNFNSAVSGLLPTISNSGDNRLLTSTGSSVGINAENNLTFDGSLLNIIGSGVFASGLYVNSESNIKIGSLDSLVIDNGTLLIKQGTYTILAADEVALYDLNGLQSISWDQRVLHDNIGNVALDWSTPDKIGVNLPPDQLAQYTLDVNGSGNFGSGLYVNNIPVSISGHTHASSDISDFNSAVSGLLPVKHIVSGTDISVTSVSGIYTINSTVNTVAESASLVTTVFNKTGSPIPKMSAVYINGGQGDQPTVALAIATGDPTSAGTYGLTFENIPDMSTGKVVVFGALAGLNTDQFNPTAPTGDVNGRVLYLSPSVSGALTLTKPSAPNHIVALGTIVRTHQNQGVIEVRVQNGFELEELHNVAISGVTNGQFLQYNGSGLWVPSSSGNFSTLLVNGTGVSLNGHSHNSSSITDFNSSVSGLLPVTNITGGSNITVSQSGTVYTVAVTGSLGLTTEEVDDRVSNLLVAGTGIGLNYDDNANTLTIAVSGLSSTAKIGDGISGVITYNLSDPLNIVGSGSTTIDYNNISKTVTIGSPSLIREYELVSSTKSSFTVTGGYALNNLDVYHNGIKLLASGDYTATNGSTFDLIQPAVSGDVVEWLGYSVVPRHQLILGEVRSDTVGNINYLGRAVAGSSEASGVWTIKRYTVADNGIDITTATASNAIWNNRLTETYL